jgi:hypothetical protein
LEDLDRDSIADLYAPPLRRPITDALDDADRLMPWDEREARRQMTGVLLVIGTAQPTRLDPQQAVVITERRQRQLVRYELPRCFEHESGRGRS